MTAGPPRLFKIAFGNAGTAQTVAQMWRLIVSPAERVRPWAEKILRDAQVQFAPSLFHAAALYTWVQDHLAYVGDNVLIEEIRSPDRLLADIESHGSAQGDCDDQVILLGALFVAIGLLPELVTISTRADHEFDHVFLVADTSSGREVADPILKQDDGAPAPFGTHVPDEAVTAIQAWPMPDSLEALDTATQIG